MAKPFRSLRCLLAGALLLAVCSIAALAQQHEALPVATPMPADRATDSYRIYSSLMPLGETAGRDWPHERWLVQDTTITVVPEAEPCTLDPATFNTNSLKARMSMNPHVAVRPAEDRRQDFNEILLDFDRHCHDHVSLDPNAWRLSVPVVLLGSEEETKYREMTFAGEPVDDKYKGAPGIYGFSLVYFNANHTVALVYATHYCGSLCGEGFWVALALENGEWKRLHWNATARIS